MDKKKTYEITIKVNEQDIEDIAQYVLDQANDYLGDNGLPKVKEMFELVLNTALNKIEDYLL